MESRPVDTIHSICLGLIIGTLIGFSPVSTKNAEKIKKEIIHQVDSITSRHDSIMLSKIIKLQKPE